MSQTPLWEQGVEGGRARPIDPQKLGQLLLDVGEALDFCEIRHVLFLGTLLGVYRDKGFIPWDDDADLACFKPDNDPNKLDVAKMLLREQGCYIPPANDPLRPVAWDNPPPDDTAIIRDGEKVELWWMTDEGTRWTYDRLRCGRSFSFERRFFDEVDEVPFLGRQWLTPVDTPGLLTDLYGVWKEPIKGRKPIKKR
jgi:hypothetical protein